MKGEGGGRRKRERKSGVTKRYVEGEDGERKREGWASLDIPQVRQQQCGALVTARGGERGEDGEEGGEGGKRQRERGGQAWTSRRSASSNAAPSSRPEAEERSTSV